MKQNNIILAVMLTFLMGCGGKQTIKEIQYVDKPVIFYIVPKPPEITKPDLLYKQFSSPEDKQKLKDDPAKATRVASLSLKQYEKYVDILESIINKYSELADKSKKKLEQFSDTEESNGPLALSKSSNTSGFSMSVNYDHLREIILTEDEFEQIKTKARENIENEETE